MTDLVDHIRATPEDRAMVRAAMRGALIRHSMACREDAEHATGARRDELITEAHHAIVRAIQWEGE